MTTSINIESLKSSLFKKAERYNALTLVLEKKETENRLLPSSIAGKNTVCVDLAKIISEETFEYEKTYSAINEKIAKRNFLAQQMAEQESSDTPHSIQVLINKLDNEILAEKIYCDALHQSVLVQTSTHDALFESANIESTEYDNLEPIITLLKDKTELLAIELATETEVFETLSGETIVFNNEENTTVTVDHDNFSIEHTIEQDTTDKNDEFKLDKQDYEDKSLQNASDSNEELSSQLTETADEKKGFIDTETDPETLATGSPENESGKAEIDVDQNDNNSSDNPDTDPDKYSLDPVELTNKLYASTITSPETNTLENKSDQNEDKLESELNADTNSDNIDAEQYDFAIDIIKLKNEQDSTSLDSSEIEIPEVDHKLDQQSTEDKFNQLNNFSPDELSADINVDADNDPDSVTIDTEQHDFEIDQVEETNEQNSTSDSSEIAKNEDNFKLDQQSFEDELAQLNNLSPDELSTDKNVDTDNSPDSVTIDTEQHDFDIDQVDLRNEQNSTSLDSSEIADNENDFELEQQSFEDEITQLNNFSPDELSADINVDTDSSPDSVTIDDDQNIFSIDPVEQTNEQDASEQKAALATAELNALEDKFMFSADLEKKLASNNRTTTRYVRGDIKTKLIVYKLLGASKPFDVELLDISSKGALIKTTTKLRKNARITLKFNFQLDARRFAIAGKIVRKTPDSAYGIKFNTYQDEFADHLLSTQTNLIFK